MDIWDDDYREPTEDERSARRTLAVAIALINSSAPIATTDLRRDFYPEISDASFRKSFQRDRARLAASGIVIVSAGMRGSEQTWRIDEDCSFVRESHLLPEDALTLNCLLLPMAADTSFPFAHDLRIALTKIDRSFRDPAIAALPRSARNRDVNLTRIEKCLMNAHAASITYTRSDGSDLKRTILPYGLFTLRNQIYLVAPEADQTGDVQNAPHTYLVSRIEKVRELARVSYDIPASFDVRDYVLLPFQIGPTQYVASFIVPPERRDDVLARVDTRGTWDDEGACTILTTSVSDERAAAMWAIAEGIEPVRPQSLVDCWKERLRAALGGE